MLQGSLGVLSNRETYIQDIQAFDEDDEVIDLTGATIVFEMRDRQTKQSALIASTANTKVVIATTTFTVTFDTTDTATLCAKQYDLGVTILIASVTTQLFAGTIDVVDGVVS
jgi:hypothetical protein